MIGRLRRLSLWRRAGGFLPTADLVATGPAIGHVAIPGRTAITQLQRRDARRQKTPLIVKRTPHCGRDGVVEDATGAVPDKEHERLATERETVAVNLPASGSAH